jgi:hypothetical protein
MEKYTINIAKDFSPKLGGRYRRYGRFSGEEFFEDVLEEKYLEAVRDNQQLHIYMDGASPYGSSFIGQSFGELGRKYGNSEVKGRIVLYSDVYKWIVTIIREQIWAD